QEFRICGHSSTGFGSTYASASTESVSSSLSVSSRVTGAGRLSYFLPTAPPGQRVASATLRVFVQGIGEFAQIRLSGKAPATTEVVRCVDAFPGLFCQFWMTWDFTAEAQAAAAQGGGLLELIPGPIEPVTSPIFQASTAVWGFRSEVDYPWRHGGPDNALTVTFTAACPKTLEVTVTPEAVLPLIPPGNTIPPAIRNIQSKATVTALVKTCPAQTESPPAPVEVSFEVRPAAPGSPEAGGHAPGHIEPRPLTAFGSFERPNGPKDTTCPVTTFDAEGMGSCTVTYHSSEVSGAETIVAKAAGFPNAEAKVTVQVPGLVNLGGIQTNFWRLTGQTTTHPDNHWGTPDTVTNIQLVALDSFEIFAATLGINDLSLRQGGMFDICGTWNPADTCPPLTVGPRGGHHWHRTGTSVDIDRTACVDPELQGGCGRGTISVPRRFIGERCDLQGQGWL
ncbi:MAG: hypothetical protein L0214_15690, partial [candidate division NC10 bacterium]|nr:hypothetical protein [candidate division NC10 bacterium]